MCFGQSSLLLSTLALYDGWNWGHGARSCLLLSYGANMCFTFARGLFFTVICTLSVPLLWRHHHYTASTYHLLGKLK